MLKRERIMAAFAQVYTVLIWGTLAVSGLKHFFEPPETPITQVVAYSVSVEQPNPFSTRDYLLTMEGLRAYHPIELP